MLLIYLGGAKSRRDLSFTVSESRFVTYLDGVPSCSLDIYMYMYEFITKSRCRLVLGYKFAPRFRAIITTKYIA